MRSPDIDADTSHARAGNTALTFSIALATPSDEAGSDAGSDVAAGIEGAAEESEGVAWTICGVAATAVAAAIGAASGAGGMTSTAWDLSGYAESR